ncbi:class I SAM-dependent methyltransferase [Virgibacillus sp. YIM 98842]|uniref:class I SAM-dependent methyltransferase n=1 Tax=Virgibacillus sp. YIM 98842 TaxID=2663533 RepID=UPI0013DAED80|nr:class I SAM-dependent methyltransferase [Virgibacillus sp. YIM 98842]
MNYSYLDCLAVLGVGGAHPGGLKLTKDLLANENLNESTKILDAGCGTGQTSAYIAREYGCHLTALDNNAIMVEKANERFLAGEVPLKAVEGTVEELPFAGGSFDIVLSESVLLFTDIAKSIPEIARVLKPNGKLIAIEMAMESKIRDKELEPLKGLYENAYFRTEEEWNQAFSHAGFKTVKAEKPEVQFDPEDIDTVPDYSLSEPMDPVYFDIMKDHEEMMKSYENTLGFRAFICNK